MALKFLFSFYLLFGKGYPMIDAFRNRDTVLCMEEREG